MDVTFRQNTGVLRFFRSTSIRIWFGIVLLITAVGTTLLLMPFLREQRVGKTIESVGGKVAFEYRGPNWFPQSVRARLPFWDRIQTVRLSGKKLTPDVLLELQNLRCLERLYLDHTQVNDADLIHLKGLTSLEWLALNRTQISDLGLKNFSGMTHLRLLCLDDTQVTDAGLKYLKGLTQLERLGLNSTHVTSDGLQDLTELTGLKRLDLNFTRVADDGLEHLKQLTHLELLYIEQTQITDEGRGLLRKSLPGCEIIVGQE